MHDPIPEAPKLTEKAQRALKVISTSPATAHKPKPVEDHTHDDEEE